MMIYRVLTLVLLLASFAFAGDEHVDFIFDIDQTFLESLNHKSDVAVLRAYGYGDQVLEISMPQGKVYGFVDIGFGALVQRLLAEIPNARVSFFSGGPKERNEQVFDLVKLPDGRTLRQVGYKFFSSGDLTANSKHEYKDLSKVTQDLSNAILIDDKVDYSVPSQRANLLDLGVLRVIDFRPDVSIKLYDLLSSGFHSEAQKLGHMHYLRLNKEFYVTGALFSAYERSKSNGTPLLDELQAVQKLDMDELIDKGVKELKSVDSNLGAVRTLMFAEVVPCALQILSR